MAPHEYLMEHHDEHARLERKTDREAVERQARWAGLRPGMRVADIGCGPGKTTAFLHELVQPGGEAFGVDASEERLARAREQHPEVRFHLRNAMEPMDDLGSCDFIWMRFFLEYYRTGAFEIVRNAASMLRPGGILCLIDLDHNCMNYWKLDPDLDAALRTGIAMLEEHAGWDPYAGRKLYSWLYELGFSDIRVGLEAHHLVYGELAPAEEENWSSKLLVALQRSGHTFEEVPGGFPQFYERIMRFMRDPGRFTYTPLILCAGVK